jgi:EmrB/QacA subfamily drug resistance transporter
MVAMTFVEEVPSGWHRLIVEPRRPAAIRNLPDGSMLAVAAVCIGAFMGQLDASIITLALPELERSFHSGVGDVSWVGLSYLLVLVATVAAVGRFADMAGRKLLYVYGFVIFIAGSALCATASSLGMLDVYRAVQAIGAAMLQANSVAIIALAVPRGKLGRALGIQGAAQAVGLALGPSVGGLLLTIGSWRLLFLINVPVGLLGVVAALLFIPRSTHLQQRVGFDWFGFAIFFPAVAAFMYAISQGDHHGWSSPVIVTTIVLAMVLGTGFILWERRRQSPMIDISMFARKKFSSGISGSLLAFAVMFGVLVVVPFYLERGAGLGTARTGLELMAMPVALGVVAPVSGRFADRFGVRRPVAAGMGLAVAGLIGLGLLHPTGTGLVGLLALVGAGLGLFNSPNNAGIMASVRAEESGAASGLLNMSRGLGTALGLAIATAVFAGLGGDGGAMSTVQHAFSITALVLAGLAAAAGIVTALGSDDQPLAHRSIESESVAIRSDRALGGEHRAPPAGPLPHS